MCAVSRVFANSAASTRASSALRRAAASTIIISAWGNSGPRFMPRR